MKIEWVTVGPFQENSYLLSDPDSGSGVLIDPGDEAARIIRMVEKAGAMPDAIWLTHAHLDHIGAISEIRGRWDVPVYLHPSDLALYRRAAQQAEVYGFAFEQPADPDRELADADQLQLGAHTVRVLHTPGHSPGHVVFLADGLMVGGDLLFSGSIGRTDLPFSNPREMETSLAKIATLDPEIVVYPGHGPPTSIGTELATNPYLNLNER
ncbi:MAG TPA: MBL fold metallo-hydrolase [Gemmatimonadaceae bacterium]|nr:MBL fold metallo-hydrolase [Gemmatimonadaceae bacterium]